MLAYKLKGILLVFSICAIFTALSFYSGQQTQSRSASTREIKYILDAGHGSPDGGTVGADGTTEASLNLSIANKISEELKNNRIPHQLTRTTESGIYSEGDTIHEKKVSDVRNRIAIAGQLSETPLISIHMNSYPDPAVYGIQVFYGNGEYAQQLAQKLQDAMNHSLQPNHEKTAKNVSKNIYLFSHIDNPVILIECGFLSNSDDLNNLKDEKYQSRLAAVISDVLAAQS